MKRFGPGLAVLLVLMVLAGALYFSQQVGNLDDSSKPSTIETRATALLPFTATRLNLWAFGGDIPAAVWQRLAQEFEKSSGYRVSVTVYDTEEKYREALRMALAEKRLPDVFLIESTEAEALWQAKQITTLDLVPKDATDWVPGVLATFRRGDKTLGFPSEFTTLALYYNATAFDRIGVAYPDVHWTWDTLLGISQAIYLPVQEDRKEPVYSIELPLRLDVWQAFSSQAGGGLYDASSWKVGAPQSVAAQTKALRYLSDFLKRYIMAPRPPIPADGRLFIEGKASMAIAGTELLRDLRGRPDMRWGVAPLPHDINRATVIKARGWVVSSACAKPADAARLARALATQLTRLSWLSAQAAAPKEGRSAAEQVFYDSAEYAQPLPFLATAPELERIINEELIRWIGQENPSPEAMIDWAQKLLK